ncbi:hypothetical protein PAB09_09670 [Corynebacterium sp. SCR221107]|uniref:hypothetical protein n=1 Tax=Corynebacterium sp. SCR221107 TaxID=3017361 RepID=UPI0022EC5382|nr:hypothetical protein [Corynebacterium sp. SCR221107]WBT08157.1 hypothetical protein PAB09_09670 [Corynebacterium sp. SCR221107]
MQAQTAVAAVQEPAEKQALEEAYLSSLQSELQGIADRAVPSTRNLMQNVVAGTSAGGSTNTGMNQVAGNGKLSTSGLNAAGMQGGTGAGAGVADPGEFAAINSEVTALQSIDTGSMSTHAASAGGLGTMSPGIGTGGVINTAGLGSQAAGSGAIGAGSVGAIGAGPNFGGAAALNPTRLGTTPAGVGGVTTPIASTDRMGTAGGMGMAPVSTMGTRGGFGGLPGATAFGGTGGTTGNGGGTPGRGAMGAANYAGRGDGGATPGVAGVGRIAAGGLGGAGNVSGATGAGGRVGAAPTVAGAPGGAVAATAQSASAGRGPGAVMGGMPMAGAGAGESKKEKMRRLTTAIEGDDNVSALLGKSTPAVPGVIGAWVRG